MAMSCTVSLVLAAGIKAEVWRSRGLCWDYQQRHTWSEDSFCQRRALAQFRPHVVWTVVTLVQTLVYSGRGSEAPKPRGRVYALCLQTSHHAIDYLLQRSQQQNISSNRISAKHVNMLNPR